MKHPKLRIAVLFGITGLAVSTYYIIGWKSYLNAAEAAFPRLPVNDCYYVPWPMGPTLVGRLAGDDPIYLNQDSVEKDSQGMRVTIAASDGTFWITPSRNDSPSTH